MGIYKRVSPKEIDKDFENAVRFFEMIDYKKGIATVLALKARVYNKLGLHVNLNHKRCAIQVLKISIFFGSLETRLLTFELTIKVTFDL